jgi:rhodanese-related sulfurtransferase
MVEETGPVLPEVTPAELAEWLREQPDLRLLDVREPYEFPRARFPDERVSHAPLSDLARKSVEGLPEKIRQDTSGRLVVFCHHGVRSAQVTAWLMDLGWESVYNLAGGIDAYARDVDPSIGRY